MCGLVLLLFGVFLCVLLSVLFLVPLVGWFFLLGLFVGLGCCCWVVFFVLFLIFGGWGWGGIECVQYNYIIISASQPCYQIGYVEPIGIILYICAYKLYKCLC